MKGTARWTSSSKNNVSLPSSPAWIEADLGRIFAEGLFADFAALWLLAHASRFGKADRPGAECALETWREKGREEGTRELLEALAS